MQKKRIFSFLLALIFIFSAFHLQVFAADTFSRYAQPSVFNPATDGQVTAHFNFEHPHDTNIYIRNSNNDKVKTIVEHQYYPGGYVDCTITWDGKDDANVPAPTGSYYVSLEVTEERWLDYNPIKISFNLLTSTSYDININPNLYGDEFEVYGSCDASFEGVTIEFGGDVEPIGEPVLEGTIWRQKVKIADETSSGYARISAYKVNSSGADFIGELNLVKHKVAPNGETLKDISSKYYADAISGVGKITSKNGIGESDSLDPNYRLLIMDPDDPEITEEFEMVVTQIKFSLDLLAQGGIWNKGAIYSVDPVNLSTGNFLITNADLKVEGAFPLVFNRFYNAIDDYRGIVGYNWHNDFDIRILNMGDGSIAVVFADGHWEEYRLDADANYIAPEGVYNELTFEKPADEGKYTLAFPDSSNFEFNQAGFLTSKFDRNGNETKFTYEGVFMSEVSTASGSLFFEYGDDGLVSSISDNAGRNVRYQYSDGNLTKFTDANGFDIAYTYDGEGRLLTVTNQRNNTTVTNTYDDQSRTTNQVFPDGGSMGYDYTNLASGTALTEQNGNKINYYYNENYCVTKEEYSDGVISKVFDSNNNMTQLTDKMGNVWNYEYDSNGNVTKETDPLGNVTAYEYNDLSQVTKVTLANSAVYNVTYDSKGNAIERLDELSALTQISYNSQGLPTSVTDPRSSSTTFEYDAKGNISSMTDGEGNISKYEYDGVNRIAKITYPEGNSNAFTYTDTSKLQTVTDGKGNTMEYTYDKADNLVSVKEFNGESTSYEYNSMNRLVKSTDALGHAVSYDYDLMWNIVKETNENGNSKTYEYDTLNRMTSWTDEEGNKTVFHYDANGNVTEAVNALNETTAFAYDALNRGVSLTNREGSTGTTTYDSVGNVTKTTDFMGFATSFEYGLKGQLTKTIDPMGGETSYIYDPNGNVISVTDPMGYKTTYEYNKLNKVTAITNPLNGRSEIQYDGNGNVSKVTDSEGAVTTFMYDANDRMTGYTDSESYTFSFEFDANGNNIKYIDGRGNNKVYVYDATNRTTSVTNEAGFSSYVVYDPESRVVQTTDAEGAVTKYQYDKNDNMTMVTDALGNSTSFEYDELNRLEKTTDAKGAVTSYNYTPMDLVASIVDAEGGDARFEYDKNGNLLKETNPESESYTYSYNALNQVVKVTNPLGHSDTFTYDANSRITSVTDRNGNKTKYQYDGNGNIVETKDALGNSSYFEYDTINRLTKMTLHRKDSQDSVNESQITLYQYDGRGLTTKVINAAENNKLFVYDGNGNLVQTTDEDGYVTEYSYEPRNLVSAINHSDKKSVAFAYNKVGELVESKDWTGENTFELDLLRRIVSVNDHNNKKVAYTYDEVGNQTSITYPDSSIATYGHDLLRRNTNVTDGDGKTTNYEYDKASRLVFMDYPNYRSEEYTYDDAGQLLKVMDTDEEKNKDILYEYSYDPQGNLLADYKRGIGIGGVKEDVKYSYDALNRLIEANEKYGKSNRTYLYDSLGNLTFEQSKNNKTVDYKLNILNQITSKIVDNKDVYSYTYDKRGNQVKEVYDKKNTLTAQYVYDETNRMVKGTNEGGENSLYTFNGLGVLVNNTWEIKDNSYGYHKMDAGTVPDPTPVVPAPTTPGKTNKNGTGQDKNKDQNPDTDGNNGLGDNKNKGNTGETGTGNSDEPKMQTVSKDFVIDYTAYVPRELMEYENMVTSATQPHGMNEGLTYRYVYGLERLSVRISGVKVGAGSVVENEVVKLYLHNDRLGSTRYATGDNDRIMSYTDYDEWGTQTQKTRVKMNLREVDVVKFYATHAFDEVLGQYYAKARMYDAQDKRFMAVDPLKGLVGTPQTLIQYTYVSNNPVIFIDLDGLRNISIVAGGDVASNHNAFNNNANTWIADNMTSEDTVIIISVGNNTITYVSMDENGKITKKEYKNEYKNANDVFKAIKGSHSDSDYAEIDELIFETHSSPSALYLRSDIVASKEIVAPYFGVPEDIFRSTHAYFMDKYINMSHNGVIRFNGCNAGGRDGKIMEDSMAQHVANMSDVLVYAWVNNTSQKKVGDRYFQVPARMATGQNVVNEQTKFTPK